VLQVHPTRRCNLLCDHCYSMSGPAEREDLPLEILLTCLEDAFALGYRQLAVSGGEPLLYKPLIDLLAHARHLGMLNTVTTNGTLITPNRWKLIAPLVDVLAISIDGREQEHDEIRRQAGAFARTIANLDIIRESGVPFGFIFTLTQFNVDSLEFVVRLAAEAQARSVQVHPLTLHGRAALTMPSSRPDGIELVAAMLEAVRLGQELGVPVTVDALSSEQLLLYRQHLVPNRPVKRLTDVASVLVVEPDGSVVPLTHEVSNTLSLGSLRKERLSMLAAHWLAAGRGELLASACERTWDELSKTKTTYAFYWYDEVGAHTNHPDLICPATLSSDGFSRPPAKVS
jgi:MoaA/NifB/PqqE/SkfB family radical SAM enzyme